jgi:dolichol-phosphate mannosyltransferase
MPEDTATARMPLPEDTATAPMGPAAQHQSLRMHTRVRHGMRRPHNWFQLIKFSLVGGSGFVVNVTTFFVVNALLGVHHIAAATVAFVLAVFNNFWWNRHWTFDSHGARHHHAGFQAARFFTVSVAAFLFALVVLELLVSNTDIPATVAQAISIVAATPLNFVGNKMWTFARRTPGAS